jgi:hypothetical protein
MRQFTRVVVAYLAGVAIAASVYISEGDALKNVLYVLTLWLPISVVYGAVTIAVLRKLKAISALGILEVCGLCIALFPVFTGGWPTYWMRWDLAIFMISVQCVALSLSALIVFLINKRIKPNQSPDPTPAGVTPPAGQESRHP